MATDVDVLCDSAASHLEAGRLEACREVLERARAIAPAHARVHYILGICHGDAGRLHDALRAVEESLRLDPGHAKAHNNRGVALQRLGRASDAEAAFRQALALDPALIPPYTNLGHLLEQRGALAEADALYARAIEHGCDREMFEQYRAALAGRDTRACPESWVRATFDNFAPAFDGTLRALGYRVPQDLGQRIVSELAGPVDILDLGCGTGQCGTALASVKRHLVGVDLAPKMLQQAERLGLYDELREAEVRTFLAAHAAQGCDVIVAADVFIYIGELDGIFRDAARVLRPGGLLAFSIEEQGERDYALLPTGRYAQSDAYVRRLAADAFAVRCADPTTIRMESGHRIAGRLYVLQRT